MSRDHIAKYWSKDNPSMSEDIVDCLFDFLLLLEITNEKEDKASARMTCNISINVRSGLYGT